RSLGVHGTRLAGSPFPPPPPSPPPNRPPAPTSRRGSLPAPRRPSHYVARAAYLGSLWVIGVTAWLATLGWTRSATVGEAARFGPVGFQVLTFVQLPLFLFFAALPAASAIPKENDRRPS